MDGGDESTPATSRRARRLAAEAAAAPADAELVRPSNAASPALPERALAPRPRPTAPPSQWTRRRSVMAVFAVFAVLAFGAVYLGPMGSATLPAAAETVPVTLYALSRDDVQAYDIGDLAPEVSALERDSYSVYVTPTPTPTPAPVAAKSTASGGGQGWSPPFVSPNPGTAQAIAYDMLMARGWGDGEFACLVALWNRESGWRVNAYNAGSGAYGIPQSLPGNKMASAGADWETNPATQIAWGLGYIGGRYGTPCGAWGHSQRTGWY